MANLYSTEIEAQILSTILQYPDTWGEFHLVDRNDWSKAHQPLYDLVALQLNSSPPGSVTPLVLSERGKGLGISSLEGGFEVYPYIEGLTTRFCEAKDAKHLAQELKRLTARRDQIARLEAARKRLVESPGISFDDMSTLVTRALTEINTAYYKEDVTELFSTMEVNIEKRADNPIDPDAQLYQGPIASINRTIGPLIFPGSFTTTIARTGAGKSAFSFFYCVHVAERYGLPILWLDAGEMTLEQIQMRAVSCLSNGKVPLWMVRTGEWRKHPVMVNLIRGDLWPRVKKLRLFYHNTSGMSAKEKVNFMRRFHYSKVARDEFLIIVEDYLKGVEAMEKSRAEYQEVGYYVKDTKSLVTHEINAGYWSSLQSNRSGITKGKKTEEMQDHEGSASLSDRISWECTNQFFMRFKEPAELAKEKGLFGNIALKPGKVREGYGREYEKILRPVKLANGGFATNYFHLGMSQFSYTDHGLHSEAMVVLGETATDLSDGKSKTAPL
jgi:replicative DNA helicase